MNKVTEKAVAAGIVLRSYAERAISDARDDERGQGSVEYVGVTLAVVAVVGVVIAAATPVGEAITEQLTNAVSNIGGGGD